jgi:hypothetical protein
MLPANAIPLAKNARDFVERSNDWSAAILKNGQHSPFTMADAKRPRRKRAKQSYQEEEEEWNEEDFVEDSDSEQSYHPPGMTSAST